MIAGYGCQRWMWSRNGYRRHHDAAFRRGPALAEPGEGPVRHGLRCFTERDDPDRGAGPEVQTAHSGRRGCPGQGASHGRLVQRNQPLAGRLGGRRLHRRAQGQSMDLSGCPI